MLCGMVEGKGQKFTSERIVTPFFRTDRACLGKLVFDRNGAVGMKKSDLIGHRTCPRNLF